MFNIFQISIHWAPLLCGITTIIAIATSAITYKKENKKLSIIISVSGMLISLAILYILSLTFNLGFFKILIEYGITLLFKFRK